MGEVLGAILKGSELTINLCSTFHEKFFSDGSDDNDQQNQPSTDETQ